MRVLRLAALLPDDAKSASALADRWKLSNADRLRLEDLAGGREKIVCYLSIREVRKLLYRLGKQRFRDRVFCAGRKMPSRAMDSVARAAGHGR